MANLEPTQSGQASFFIPHNGPESWLHFSSPVRTVIARRVDEVMPALLEVERAVKEGAHAAGFLAYEAAPAFDAHLVSATPGPLPLLWFGIYDAPTRSARPPLQGGGVTGWTLGTSRDAYVQAVQRIKEYIAAGDTYQVNFTTRLTAHDVRSRPTTPATACIETDRFLLWSASPELFFHRTGSRITCRPMKGTAPRGLTHREDQDRAQALFASAKDRAENVMIVDMVRNDLGRIARPGSVKTESLYDIEKYETLFQMTSTVSAESDRPVSDIFRALFPSASVTGAPKVRTMEIIRELEPSARGIYTGSMGYLAPDGTASFNIAIRTVQIDKETGTAEYGIGSGVVWDSQPLAEFEECATKALVVTRPAPPPFELLETLLWRPESGYWLLERHLDRMSASAAYFEIPFDRAKLEGVLEGAASAFPGGPRRVRLLLDGNGDARTEDFNIELPPDLAFGLAPPGYGPGIRVSLAEQPVDRGERFLYHKTTHRAVYEVRRASDPDVGDVLLQNEEGELTESTLANIVVSLGGRLVTPPVSCGLLGGTFRSELLDARAIEERVVPVADLAKAQALYLVNSVRGWMTAQL